jgi:ribonuclease P protein component
VSSAASRAGERLRPTDTVRRTSDYQLCYRQGVRRGGELFVLHARPNGLDRPRLGTTVSRKVGGAVVRNRLKRWARESFRRAPARDRLPAQDFVVQFRAAAASCARPRFDAELERLIAAAQRAAEKRTPERR